MTNITEKDAAKLLDVYFTNVLAIKMSFKSQTFQRWVWTVEYVFFNITFLIKHA